MTYHATANPPPPGAREPFIVRPLQGYLVRHPLDGRPLPPEGRDGSTHRIYFERRIARGDCERVTRTGKD